MAMKKVTVNKGNMSKAVAVATARHLLENGEQLTVAELSALFGKQADVSPTALIQIASNNYTPSLYVAMTLATFLQLNVEDLFEMVSVND